MKQATVKTLGAAALGAAIAATGAGSASAVGLDGVQDTAGNLVRTLPVEETADDLPGESGEIVKTGTEVLTGENAELPLASDALSHTTQGESSTSSSTDPNQLLGGLPVGELTGGGLPLPL
ncbi:ATP-binding protein [Streptomyces sp. 6N223]|uniref:ATP-binding protein n=1 Tax=Streptomyces sp. 6N223 TaxID=3457412 RepID=UPI003FD5AB25